MYNLCTSITYILFPGIVPDASKRGRSPHCLSSCQVVHKVWELSASGLRHCQTNPLKMCLTLICCRIFSFFSYIIYLGGIVVSFASNWWSYYDLMGARYHRGLWKHCLQVPGDNSVCEKLDETPGTFPSFFLEFSKNRFSYNVEKQLIILLM